MSQFEKASKPFGETISLDEKSDAVLSGKAKYVGPRFVGIFLERELVNTNVGESWAYKFHAYANPMDESRFGEKPDGDIVSLWGSKIINDAFEFGKDGAGIPVGAVVQIVFNGRKIGKSGFAKVKGYGDYEVGFFMPKATFSSAGTSTVANAAQVSAPIPAPKFEGNKSLEELGY